MRRATSRIRIALVNDYELIVEGLHELLAPYNDTLEFVELQAGRPARHPVDVALYDSFAMGVAGWSVLDDLVQDPLVDATIVYTAHLPHEDERDVLNRGVRCVLPKQAGAQEIVATVVAVASGAAPRQDKREAVDSGHGKWPGKSHGLSEREAETLALICQGHSNIEVAERLIVTLNTVKTYIRSSYRKIGVTTRAEAVLWGSNHGFASQRIPLARLHATDKASASKPVSKFAAAP